MIKENTRIVKKYLLRNRGKSIYFIVCQNEYYYSIYKLIDIFISTTDPKGYLKKNLKRDDILNSIYKQFIRYDLDKKQTAMINAFGFNIIISFLANESLDDLKNYIDQQNDPIIALDSIIQEIIQEINTKD